jgi:hypothetical protein
MSRFKTAGLAVLWLCSCNLLFAQQKNRLGLSVIADKASTAPARAAVGISFERMIVKRGSVEIGFYYRSTINDNIIFYSPFGGNSIVSLQHFVLEKFISIPLLYGYKSKAINFSIGPSADIYLGWLQKKLVTDSPGGGFEWLHEYKFDNKVLWGLMTKMNKTFALHKHWLIEPGIYFNPIFTKYSVYSKLFTETRQYYGIALAAKYCF